MLFTPTAALVLWPRAGRMAAIAAAHLPASLPYLEDLVEQWLQGGAAPDTQAWRDAGELAEAMVRGWPSGYGHNGAYAARMLTSLAYLRHAALIDVYLEQVAAGRFAGEEAGPLAEAALLLPRERAAALIDAIVAANVSYTPGPCAALLSRCYRASTSEHVWLAPAMRRLTDALLGRYASPVGDGRRRPVAIDAAAALAVLAALRDSGDRELAVAVVELCWPLARSTPYWWRWPGMWPPTAG